MNSVKSRGMYLILKRLSFVSIIILSLSVLAVWFDWPLADNNRRGALKSTSRRPRPAAIHHRPETATPGPTTSPNFDGFPERQWNIKHGRILYLVMGDGYPPERWLDRSRWRNISLLYTSWKVDVTESLRNLTGSHLRVTYFPKSTWTTGRNHQLQIAKLWEQEQKWQFEIFVFFDADVWFLQRMGDSIDTIVRIPKNESDDVAIAQLNKNLLRDRPLQATVMFRYQAKSAACQCRCGIDHAVMAFHRTAVELTVPYVYILDSESWWYSASIQNHFAAAVYPSYCVEYMDIGIDERVQTHGKYPHGGALNLRWRSPVRFVGACLADSGLPGFHSSMSLNKIGQRISKLNPGSKCRPPAPADVDYYAMARRKRWLRYLHCLEWGPQRIRKADQSKRR